MEARTIENLLNKNPTEGNDDRETFESKSYNPLNSSNLDEDNYNPREKSALLSIMYGTLASTAGIYFGYFQSIFNPLGEKLLRLHYKVDDVNSYYGNLNLFFPIGAGLGCILGGL